MNNGWLYGLTTVVFAADDRTEANLQLIVLDV